VCTGFWWGNLREGDHWGDPGVDGRIILGWIFSGFGRKNPQYAFLRRGSKAVCPMSQICGMLKIPGNYMEVEFSSEICRPFLAHFRSSLPEGSHVA